MPPKDPTAPLDPGQDPAEDTQDGTTEDTAQDTQQDTTDWQARYRELQSFSSRRIRELETQVGTTDSDEETEDDEDDEDSEYEEEQDEPGADRLERDSWRLAEREYGRGAISAYDRAARVLDRASTPSDYVGAFEAYYQARIEQDAKRFAREQAKGKARNDSQPPIDPNRSDTDPRNANDPEAEAAFARGDSRGWLLSQIQRVRGER